MAKKGALKSVYIVNDDDLRVNGGRWLLQSGPAIRVRGFTADTLGDRKVTGGDALPIYVLSENDIRANGGQFLLKGGQPISVTSAIATARGVIQGKAIPVWPVDDDGNFDSSFAGFLPTQVGGLIMWLAADLGLSLSDGDPVATWPDQSGNSNDATQGAGVAQPTFKTGIQNGQPVVRFDGASDFMATGAFAADLTQPNTIFVVMDVKDAEGDDFYIYDGINAAKRHAWLTNIARAPDGPDFFAGAEWKPDIAMPKNVWRIHTVLYNGASSEWWQNGVSQGSANTGVMTLSGLTIARNKDPVFTFMDGDIAEMILYDAELSSVDRISVEQYLSNKWGI